MKVKIILAILIVSSLTLVGCGGGDSDNNDALPPILNGAYYSNGGGILLSMGINTEALYDNVLIKSSNTSQTDNTLKITQLTDPTGINKFSNENITATYDGNGVQVSGFNTTTYLHRLPGNQPVPSYFAGSYQAAESSWTINQDNTFTATSTTKGCLITGELVYGPLYYVVANTVATNCTDSRYNGIYREGYAVYGDLPNGEDWLGVVMWRKGAAMWDDVPLN